MPIWQTVLSKNPTGLVFDIDGTLSPIAPTPAQATLFPGVTSLLEQARSRAHVAILTGRAVENGASMVNVEGLTYIGSHGLEWCDGLPASHQIQIAPEALAYQDASTQLMVQVERLLADIPDLLIERKRLGGSIHYRLSSDPEQVRTQILARLAHPVQEAHMRLSEGKRVIEIKIPLEINKGHALRTFVEHFQLQGVLFAGDDRTDLDAILEARKLRQEGLATTTVAVQHPDTPPDLLAQADVVVQEVEGMVELLAELVQELLTKEVN